MARRERFRKMNLKEKATRKTPAEVISLTQSLIRASPLFVWRLLLYRLFQLLSFRRLRSRTARAATVFSNEFDASFFKSRSDVVSSCLPAGEPAFRSFQALYGWKRDVRT